MDAIGAGLVFCAGLKMARTNNATVGSDVDLGLDGSWVDASNRFKGGEGKAGSRLDVRRAGCGKQMTCEHNSTIER